MRNSATLSSLSGNTTWGDQRFSGTPGPREESLEMNTVTLHLSANSWETLSKGRLAEPVNPQILSNTNNYCCFKPSL